MALKLTYNPAKLKTGDTVYFLYTPDNAKSLAVKMRPVPAHVVEKREFMERIDIARIRRRYYFKLRAANPIDGGQQDFDATETTQMFTSLANLNKFLGERQAQWAETFKAHDQRHADLEGIVYENA